MDTIKSFHTVTIGESHRVKNIPCQDAANHFEYPEKGIFIGAVSDGHGGENYFRSDRGSKMAVDISIKSIEQFVTCCDKNLFNVGFIQRHTRASEIKKGLYQKHSNEDIALNRLFSSIIAQWNDSVKEDWFKNTPAKEELDKLNILQELKQSYLQGNSIEEAYGCTIIAFARTADFWFVFQLGDGKCIAFNNTDYWEPVPWDEQCNGNITTSICEINAIDNFRYSYGNERFPAALFIGSDGMDGAYGDYDELSVTLLAKLYLRLLRKFAEDDFDETIKYIREDLLPKLSIQGVARDDLSIAGWVDMEKLKKMLPLFLRNELEESLKTETEKKDRLEVLIARKQQELQKINQEILTVKNHWLTKTKECEAINAKILDIQNEYVQVLKEIDKIAKEIGDLRD
ncbi:MAG: protein phosphatase 2C domain-containing protein [Bacteroidales bacterium]|nr:protein phosphatase 2C domain-containing protein [Bacteroidales bacterium]